MTKRTMPERVTFTTDDGVTIVGYLFHGTSGGPWALLLHMMPATKESWDAFAGRLVELGFAGVLAIDERGHGESTAGPGGAVLRYQDFTDSEQQAKRIDVEAALRWLAGRGADLSRTLVAGASIGANLSIACGASHPEVPAVVALSPGLDYRGVTTRDAIARIPPSTAVLLAASKEDEYSFLSVRELAAARPSASLVELEGAGHGTAMFERRPAFMDDVLAWVRDRLCRP